MSDNMSMLKQVRTEKGYSLEMVHEATNIPLDVLRAVEEGYKVRSLSPFYYKAFIRTYAKYLEVDGDLAVEQFMNREDQLGMKLTKKEVKKEFTPPKSKLDNKVQEVWTPTLQKQVTKVIVGAVIFFIALKLVWMLGAWIVGGIQSWQTESKVSKEVVQEEVQEEKKKKVIPVSQAPSQSPVAQVDQARPQSIVISKNVMATVRATKDTFLIVQSDGKTVFQSKMRKGSVETWAGAKEVVISGKDLDSLEYEINGELIGQLSRRDAQAKRIIITQKGLTIKK